MAYWKIRKSLLIISFFTCIALVHCRSLLEFSGKEKTNEGGGEQYMSDHEGFYEAVDDIDYLSDDAGVSGLLKKSIIKGQLVSSSEAAWDAMSPKLRCGDSFMKLQLSGREVANVKLCRGNGVPVPLTQLPPHCGHTTPTFGGLVYATPYDGCGVAQQGGNYVMQMQWQGNSAVISCPLISTTANETFLGPHPPEYVQILLPHSSSDTPSLEATPVPQLFDTATLKPIPPGYPDVYPQKFWPYYLPPYHYPGKVYPTAKPTEKPTTTTLVAQAPTEKPQLPKYPQMFWPYYYHPHYHYHGKPKPTALVAPPPTEKPQPPKYPQMFWPYYYYTHYHGKPKPTASVAQTPTEKPQPPKYPQMFWLYYYHPHYHYHGKSKPWEKPAPAIPTPPPPGSPALTQKPQPPAYPGSLFPQYSLYPNYPLYLQQIYQQYPVQPLKTPTALPTTTTPQPCTTTAATECQPFANQPPKVPPQQYIPFSSVFHEKDPFALQFVDFLELDANSFS